MFVGWILEDFHVIVVVLLVVVMDFLLFHLSYHMFYIVPS